MNTLKAFDETVYILNTDKIEENWTTEDLENLLVPGDYNVDLMVAFSTVLGIDKDDFQDENSCLDDWYEAIIDALKENGFMSERSQKLRLVEDACCIDSGYEAQAEDSAGNIYTVYWNLDPDYERAVDENLACPPDESSACDWDHPRCAVNAKTGERIFNVELVDAF